MDKMALAIQDKSVLEAASGEGCSGVKSTKQAHNAKERLRRMNLNASYSALRYLLPNSKRSKKRWSAPKILDKALRYIPELQTEIERLTSEKEKRALRNGANKSHTSSASTSITVTEVTIAEYIIQVCTKSTKMGVLSGLMRKAEDKGMSIKGCSSIEVSDDRICCHLQIEIFTNRPAGLLGIDHITILRDELASWLQ